MSRRTVSAPFPHGDPPLMARRVVIDGEETIFEESSGNIFADLGLPDPEIHMEKAKIARVIDRIVREEFVSQAEAAAAMGLAQPDLSNIVRGRFRGISLERMMRALIRLHRRVTIQVEERPTDDTRLEVVTA